MVVMWAIASLLEEGALILVLRFRPLVTSSDPTDSLAQEVIYEIINHVLRQDMSATSLVARCWRRPSQQRNFEFVLFESDDVTRWEANVPRDTDSIPSYVRHVRFKNSPSRLEPGILSCVLKTFASMISLDIEDTNLPPPDELAIPVSLGESGKCTTRVTLVRMRDPITVISSFNFSIPNLKELVIARVDSWPDKPPPIILGAFQRGLSEFFIVPGHRGLLYDDIALWRLAPRRLSLGPSAKCMNLIMRGSSEVVVELTLIGTQPLRDCDE